MAHWSDCAVHNAPALPVGPCDCGNDAPETNVVYGVDFHAKPNWNPPGTADLNGVERAEE